MTKRKLFSFAKLLLSSALISTLLLPFIAESYFVVTTPNHKEFKQYQFELKPGEKITNQLKVRSILDEPIKVKVYGIDAIPSGSGTFSMSVPTRPQRTIGKWTSFEEPEFVLNPKETKFLNFTITVPEAAPPGSYAGGMIAETDATSGQGTAAPSGSTVRSSARVAIKAFVDVPGDKVFKLGLKEFAFEEGNRFNTFKVKLENEGNTIIRAESSININGMNYNQTEKADNIIVFQKESTPFNIKWKKEPIVDVFHKSGPIKDIFEINKPFFGPFEAELTIKYSMYDLATNSYTNEQTITEKISFWIIPWGQILLVGSLILLIILHFIIKKIRLKMLIKKCRPYTIKEGDTLINIAQAYKINWKKLAKINNLQPPYSLAPGSSILVPQPKLKTPPAAPPQTKPPQTPPPTKPTTPAAPPAQTPPQPQTPPTQATPQQPPTNPPQNTPPPTPPTTNPPTPQPPQQPPQTPPPAA